MATKRMEGEARLQTILDAGARLAGKFGAKNVTRKMVAEAAKASPALVAYYAGTTAEAQKAYAKRAKKMGIEQPAKEKIEAIGLKMRAHGPRQAPVKRARAAKEVKAIKRNVAKRDAKVAKVVKAAKVVKTPAKKVTAKAATAALAGMTPDKAKRAPANKAVRQSPEQAIKTLPQPVTPVNVPPPVAPKKKPAVKTTAARLPLPAPVMPPTIQAGPGDVVN